MSETEQRPDPEQIEKLIKEANLSVGDAVLKYIYTLIKSDSLKKKIADTIASNNNKLCYSEIDIGDPKIAIRVFADVHDKSFEYKISIMNEETATTLMSEFIRYRSYITLYTTCIMPTLSYYSEILHALGLKTIEFNSSPPRIQYFTLAGLTTPPACNLVIVASYYNSEIGQFVKSQ